MCTPDGIHLFPPSCFSRARPQINYPEYFVLPKGIYEVALPKPLGIAFEEIEVGKGVKVRRVSGKVTRDTGLSWLHLSPPPVKHVVPSTLPQVVDLVEGGNAAKSGVIAPGHVLLAVTAIKVRFVRKN
eukprot:scaffold74050_cov37-Tisochrysis_lutea.AAC.9